MYQKITLILIYLFVFSSDEWSEALVIKAIDHGSIECNLLFCQINCDYGYITSGKYVYSWWKDDPPPTCVKTMAFMIGKFLLFQKYLLRNVSIVIDKRKYSKL